jgi:hypothetical protein
MLFEQNSNRAQTNQQNIPKLNIPSAKILSSENQNLMYVLIPSPQAANKNFKFVIDPGASKSIIKARSLEEKTLFCEDEILTINGVSEDSPINTSGYSFLNFEITDENKPIQHKFHIINCPSGIPFDGLIGNDLLLAFCRVINYENKQLIFKNIKKALDFYVIQKDNEEVRNIFTHTKKGNTLTLKARTETLVEIKVLNPEIKEGIIPDTLIKKHIFLSKAITKVNENNTAYATMLNADVEDFEYFPLEIVLEPIPQDLHKVASSYLAQSSFARQLESQEMRNNRDHKPKNQNIKTRTETLKSLLKLEHLNEEEYKKIMQICSEFNEIFYLPGDKLSFTDIIQHEIKTTTDSPVKVKSYRPPESLRKEIDK